MKKISFLNRKPEVLPEVTYQIEFTGLKILIQLYKMTLESTP